MILSSPNSPIEKTGTTVQSALVRQTNVPAVLGLNPRWSPPKKEKKLKKELCLSILNLGSLLPRKGLFV